MRNRGLVAEHFLAERLPDSPAFADFDVAPLHAELLALWHMERETLAGLNEAQTEERFVKPVLSAVGFHYTVQAGLRFATGRRQPDYALFASDAERRLADTLDPENRYRRAVAVADAKRWDRPLDVKPGKGEDSADPVAQVINYVLITKREWGILTNGRLWRLYAASGRLTEGACLEVDLIQLLETGDPDDLRWFAAFFSATALTAGVDGVSPVRHALDESRANAVQVGDALQRQVFEAVPLIAEGLLDEEEPTEQALALAFDNSLVLLYRLLFCLYAEARALLPVGNSHYDAYSLRRQKLELAADIDGGRAFSARSDDLYNDLRGLFRIVDKGDDAIGVTEYNGGLFSLTKHPYFGGRSIPDRLLAKALDLLYRVDGQFVDYRDLSVRHLGTIYERLLDFHLEQTDDGLALVPASGRHETGSYFTPAHIVDAIVERTLTPLLERRSEAAKEAGLSGEEALEELLRIRVVDPAMGSGHFLVAAAEYLAQHIASDPAFDGELDLADVRRLVAERCLYGVDLNPMAVELAQLSLWLSTVRRNEPLTFLGNLRVGNSLVGVEVGELATGDDTLFLDNLATDIERIVSTLDRIASTRSDTGKLVREKERLAAVAEQLREPLARHADLTLEPRFGDGSGPFFHWQLEFPEVFLDAHGRPRADGGFDAVIGNPPYVRIQELGRELAAYCRQSYDWAAGSFDVYVPFVERGVNLLSPNGRLGFIIPNKWLKLDYGKKMREALAATGVVEEIVDFGDAQVFEGATNYTCVLVADAAGRKTFDYRRLHGDVLDVRAAVTDLAAVGFEPFHTTSFGTAPWVLAVGDEARILKLAQTDCIGLGDLTEKIFTGLQTNADPIYIVEDRGRRGTTQVVYSRASQRELELEPDLLKRLASGAEVERYSFGSLGDLLLFPYRRQGGAMHLISERDLDKLPLTAAYLAEHEQSLRRRERSKMDQGGWYGYVYPKSLGAHDREKLGVAATVNRLEIAADPHGAVYFHNVRVNGILPSEGGVSLWFLLTVLNARLLDYIFRRGSVHLANGFFAANKQFISELPVKVPSRDEISAFVALGRQLWRDADGIQSERSGFLSWLDGFVGARTRELEGVMTLRAYDAHSLDELVAVLARNRQRLAKDPESRSFREQLAKELGESLDRLGPLKRSLEEGEREADRMVYDLYGLTEADRAIVDAEYE